MSADDDVIDVEAVAVHGEPVSAPTTAALVHVAPGAGTLTKPVAELAEIVEAFREYEKLRTTVIQPEDEQNISGKKFVKKSGWRKMAVVMGVSSEISVRDYQRDDRGRIISAEVIVRAIAPNGRFMDGLGACDFHERCCPKAFAEDAVCKHRGNHTHCKEGCDGFNHFSKPQHDIPATASTRALNRACADLFGFGEVSAEEVTDRDEPAEQTDKDAIIAALNGIEAAVKDSQQRKSAKGKFVEQFGMPNELLKGQIEPAKRFVKSNGGTFTDPAAAPDGSHKGPAESSAAPSASPKETSGSSGSVGAGPSETDSAESAGTSRPAPTSTSTDTRPSTPQQRRTIGIAFRQLVEAGIATNEDKPILTSWCTDGRVESTTEAYLWECSREIQAVHLLQSEDLAFGDGADGGRALIPTTERGAGFMRPIVEARKATARKATAQ